MNLRMPRAKLPFEPLSPASEVPRQEMIDVEAQISRLPHPRSDPLSPAVADLMSKAILESGEAYVQSVVNEVDKDYAAYGEYRAQVHAWAEGERARFKARAEDIAQAHAEMLQSRDKFLALPRTEQTTEAN